MAQVQKQSSSADGVAWNLQDLYRDPDDPQISADLDSALQRAEAFESSYRGQINVEGGPACSLLLTALNELESLTELMDKPAVYAGLLHAAKTDDPPRGARATREGGRTAAATGTTRTRRCHEGG